MFNSKNRYKDSVPFDTIKRIRESLHQIGLEVYEEKWENVSSECFSVRLSIDGFPEVGMNGKGITRSFALASAYGELIERLQNKKLFKKTYGLKIDKYIFPDEKLGSIVRFSEEDPTIMKHLVYDYKNECFFSLFDTYPKLSYFSEFYSVFENKSQSLPVKLINMACGTNGMCAGNTSFEALSHGICEIMERYVLKKILYNQLILPTIPIKNVKDAGILNLIKLLEKEGLEVIIKDCTLGGVYPVVGILLLNKSKTRYQFRLGSESLFSIALERCFTEIFQGGDIQSFIQHSMLPIEYNFEREESNIRNNLMRISKNGTGQFPASIFYNLKVKDTYKKAFLMDMKNNKQAYEHLLKILKHNKYELYVRNLSFLDFPSYKIYIPGMSEIFICNTKNIEDKIKQNKIGIYLLNIQKCNTDELEILLEKLKKYCNINLKDYSIGNSPYFKVVNLHLNKANEFEKLDVRLITSLLCYILGEYKGATKYFNEFMGSLSNKNYSNLNYYYCLKVFLDLKSKALNNEEIYSKIVNLFPENTIRQVLEDFKDHPIKLITEMPLPSCPDCDKCNISKYCLWEKWKKINAYINDKLDFFDSYCTIN